MLELVDDSWPRDESDSRRLVSSGTQFQPLDARSLLARGLAREMASRTGTSTPASSLDLEWENEGVLPLHPLHYSPQRTARSEDESATTGSVLPGGASGWSRVSSPDSLEWDPVEPPMSELDVETEQLITEIERLTSRALRETGDWTS